MWTFRRRWSGRSVRGRACCREVRSHGDRLSDGGCRSHARGGEHVFGRHAAVRAAAASARMSTWCSRASLRTAGEALRSAASRSAPFADACAAAAPLCDAPCADARRERTLWRVRAMRRERAPGAFGSGADVVDDGDRGAGRDGLAFLDQQFANGAGYGRGDLGVDFVGRDFNEGFVFLDGVAGLLEPLRDRPFGDGFAELRHRDRRGHRFIPSFGA